MKEFCVDLGLAKELEENGFPHKSSFEYEVIEHTGGGEYVHMIYQGNGILAPHPDCSYTVYAPTSDEILKELPKEYDTFPFQIHYFNSGNYWDVGYYDYEEPYLTLHGEKLSNALAKMWLYLKKEGYIK